MEGSSSVRSTRNQFHRLTTSRLPVAAQRTWYMQYTSPKVRRRAGDVEVPTIPPQIRSPPFSTSESKWSREIQDRCNHFWGHCCLYLCQAEVYDVGQCSRTSPKCTVYEYYSTKYAPIMRRPQSASDPCSLLKLHEWPRVQIETNTDSEKLSGCQSFTCNEADLWP
jgi:hypothetical protein